jgi:CDGSH-type Zn-finger protein
MSEAKIAGTKPHVLKLEPGSYWWCACGRSASQPFCDGSHAGTGLEPVEVVIEAPRTAALCLCKQTAGAPFCDGSHSKL